MKITVIENGKVVTRDMTEEEIAEHEKIMPEQPNTDIRERIENAQSIDELKNILLEIL